MTAVGRLPIIARSQGTLDAACAVTGAAAKIAAAMFIAAAAVVNAVAADVVATGTP